MDEEDTPLEFWGIDSSYTPLIRGAEVEVVFGAGMKSSWLLLHDAYPDFCIFYLLLLYVKWVVVVN